MTTAFDGNPSWDGQANTVTRRVWFTGTSALRKGQGVVYVVDSGTAANVVGARGYEVQLPTSGTYALAFAGVAARDYTANALGQSIDIVLPGSVCEIACLADTTINSGILGFIVSSDTGLAGLFYTGGLAGLGSAVPFQTTTTGVTGSSVDGTAAVATTTVTKTGLFTGAAVGDKVAILVSSTTAGAAGATRGVYTISSVTSADAAELTASAGTGDIAAVVYDPNARVQARLLSGPDHISGAINFVGSLDNAAASPTHIANGYNLVWGGVTLGAGVSTATLANGVFFGQRVGFEGLGTLTTSGYSLTVTSGEKLDGTTDITTLVIDAAGELVVLEWLGKWQLQAAGGGVTVT